jgi:acyl dehydratase
MNAADLDTSLVGTEVEPFQFPVERGQIRSFCRAIFEDSPTFLDAERPPAPPTFTRAMNLWSENFVDHYFSIGIDVERVLHGEQRFQYHGLVHAGDTLTVKPKLAEMFTKEGRRGGLLTFVVHEFVFTNQHGRDVVRTRNVTIQASKTVDGTLAAGSTGPAAAAPGVPQGAELLKSWTSPAITRAQIARYAGAVGDFNPMHCDEAFAQRAGLPSVFAHGMLGGGILSRYLADLVGLENIRTFSVRFHEQQWPGMTLTCSAGIIGRHIDGGEEHLEYVLRARDHNDRLILSSTATTVMPIGDARDG